MLLSHKPVVVLYFGWYLPIKDKTVALGRKGNADTSSSGSSIEFLCAPILNVKKIMYINRAHGDVV